MNGNRAFGSEGRRKWNLGEELFFFKMEKYREQRVREIEKRLKMLKNIGGGINGGSTSLKRWEKWFSEHKSIEVISSFGTRGTEGRMGVGAVECTTWGGESWSSIRWSCFTWWKTGCLLRVWTGRAGALRCQWRLVPQCGGFTETGDTGVLRLQPARGGQPSAACLWEQGPVRLAQAQALPLDAQSPVCSAVLEGIRVF